MSTKMKGLFKGLRYISEIFDEDQQKEEDFQIGLPTDVKHVAHIGWDGPGSANSTSADSPNWIKDSGPSTATGKDNPEVKWISEDSKRARATKKCQDGEGSKPSRRRSTDNNPLDTSPKANKPKPRQSRRNKDSSDAAASQDSDAPKKTRRKKSEAGDQSAGPRRPKNRTAVQKSDDEEREGAKMERTEGVYSFFANCISSSSLSFSLDGGRAMKGSLQN